MDAAVRYHINPETGQPNKCLDGDTCVFGGPDFHYPDKHDAEVAWNARQLERGVIAYRNVMQAKEREEEEAALSKLTGNAKGLSKKLSWGVAPLDPHQERLEVRRELPGSPHGLRRRIRQVDQ